MHKSRIGTIVIDCKTDNLDEDANFWSQALGHPAKRAPDPTYDHLVSLQTKPNEITLYVQSVDHPPRVHLDIETDDIEKEVGRLEKLGAVIVGEVKSWVVMQAPTGHRFCVVKPQRANFEVEANCWE